MILLHNYLLQMTTIADYIIVIVDIALFLSLTLVGVISFFLLSWKSGIDATVATSIVFNSCQIVRSLLKIIGKYISYRINYI